MEAGRLDRRIRIEFFTEQDDAAGEAIKTWFLLVDVAASAEPVKDGERMRAAETAAVIDMRFVIRWSSEVAGVSALNRVIYDGRIFAVAGVKEVGRRDGLELSCQARSERL